MVEVKCNKCGEEFPITNTSCPKCGDPVKTSCKFYCGTCETKLKFGEFKCRECGKYPKEIIVEQKNGELIRIEFKPSEMTPEDYYTKKMFKKYVLIPNLIYWLTPLVLGSYLLYILRDFSLCSLDSNCGYSSDFFDYLEYFILFYYYWVIYTWPVLPFLIGSYFKYRRKIDINNIKEEESDLKIRCRNCDNYFYLSRGTKCCPKCKKKIDDAYRIYCGKCETEMTPGEVFCSNCLDKPEEVIVKSKSTNKTERTTFEETD